MEQQQQQGRMVIHQPQTAEGFSYELRVKVEANSRSVNREVTAGLWYRPAGQGDPDLDVQVMHQIEEMLLEAGNRAAKRAAIRAQDIDPDDYAEALRKELTKRATEIVEGAGE